MGWKGLYQYAMRRNTNRIHSWRGSGWNTGVHSLPVVPSRHDSHHRRSPRTATAWDVVIFAFGSVWLSLVKPRAHLSHSLAWGMNVIWRRLTRWSKGSLRNIDGQENDNEVERGIGKNLIGFSGFMSLSFWIFSNLIRRKMIQKLKTHMSNKRFES